jgi:hypothetical protein
LRSTSPGPSRILTDGLSLDILLGVLVVLVMWVLTWAHAECANRITNQRVWIDNRLTRAASTEAAGPLSAKVER